MTSATDTGLILEIEKTFSFEAAHHFSHMPEGHPFSRLHGHSFEGTVTVRGAADAQSGFVHDTWALDAVIREALEGFDHGYLNDIADLPTPSLENIAATLFKRLDAKLAGLACVEVRRPSCGEAARVRRAEPG